MKILVVAEHLEGQVQEVTRELVAAAMSLGGPVTLALIAEHPEELLEQAKIAGVDEIVTVRTPAVQFESDLFRQAVEAVYRHTRPEAILMGFTVNSIGYGSALAAKLGLGFASDVFALRAEGEQIVAHRAFYGGKVHGELDFPQSAGVVLLLRKGAWAPAEGSGTVAASDLKVDFAKSRTRHLEFKEAESSAEVDITTADFLLCVGRGIGEKENLERFEQLAGKMGATLAVSRPLVDAGWAPRARQVGQSGKTVKPKVYLSLGVSGAVQHLAGMKNAGLIISVNTDPEAAIFGVAHYGGVVDLFALADELEKRF